MESEEGLDDKSCGDKKKNRNDTGKRIGEKKVIVSPDMDEPRVARHRTTACGGWLQVKTRNRKKTDTGETHNKIKEAGVLSADARFSLFSHPPSFEQKENTVAQDAKKRS